MQLTQRSLLHSLFTASRPAPAPRSQWIYRGIVCTAPSESTMPSIMSWQGTYRGVSMHSTVAIAPAPRSVSLTYRGLSYSTIC